MSDPQTPSEWLALVTQHEVAARALVYSKVAAGQAVFHCGLAVECALKAYIMSRERLDSWPSRDGRPELYVHDLRQLRSIAAIKLDTRTPQAAGWHMILQWDRGQGYDPQPMPRKVARAWVDAAFGSDGLVTWIRQNCR